MTRETDFNELVKRVKKCRLCDRMEGSERVLSSGCGSLNATVVFVGEAPGRLGADVSAIPFHGDQSGHNFETFLEQVGLSRYDVFVTNAVLCNPKDENGNNVTPTSSEISRCAPFLAQQLDLIRPKVVVTLGAVALKSTAIAEPHALELRRHVRTAVTWRGTTLIPLYHPGQRALIHRSFPNQLADYQFVAENVRRLTKKRSVPAIRGRASLRVAAAAEHILSRRQPLSYFALQKLLFLAEVEHFEQHGSRLTDGYVVRQKDGPYFVDLHPQKLARTALGFHFYSHIGKLFVTIKRQHDLLSHGDSPSADALPRLALESLNRAIEKYGTLSESQLKTRVYLTREMRTVLRKEKHLRANLFNASLLEIRPRTNEQYD